MTHESSSGSDTIPSLAEPAGRTGVASLTGRATVGAPAVVRLLGQFQQGLTAVPVARHDGIKVGMLCWKEDKSHITASRGYRMLDRMRTNEETKVELEW